MSRVSRARHPKGRQRPTSLKWIRRPTIDRQARGRGRHAPRDATAEDLAARRGTRAARPPVGRPVAACEPDGADHLARADNERRPARLGLSRGAHRGHGARDREGVRGLARGAARRRRRGPRSGDPSARRTRPGRTALVRGPHGGLSPSRHRWPGRPHPRSAAVAASRRYEAELLRALEAPDEPDATPGDSAPETADAADHPPRGRRRAWQLSPWNHDRSLRMSSKSTPAWLAARQVDLPPVTAGEIVGLTHVMSEIAWVVERLGDTAAARALGAQPPKGILFYGPPGSGKTLVARYLAGTLGSDVPMYEMSSDELTAPRVRSVFRHLAGQAGRSVLYLDEVDAWGPSNAPMRFRRESSALGRGPGLPGWLGPHGGPGRRGVVQPTTHSARPGLGAQRSPGDPRAVRPARRGRPRRVFPTIL